MQLEELDHLEILLEKQPIVVTRSAQALLERPKEVQEDYIKHTRSFVVLGRNTASTGEEQTTIEDYEKRLIQLVKNKRAAKGYITADYGYGKTSTAVFLWRRCEEANIVAVPPFQIERLNHFLDATYGWIRFKLQQNYPQLLPKAEQIYQAYINRDINKSGRTQDQVKLLQQYYQEGRFILDLQPVDYVHFFEEMTNLVQEAGFDGLVVIADEVQQYIDPDIKSGVKDPLTPLLTILHLLMTRAGHLPFALILSIPLKELGLINDQRADLVHRFQSDKLTLDLSVVYNQSFASNLWRQLAQTLQFESLKDKIVLPETLESLGQISARDDLASGPRTVIDVFKLMTKRYKDHGGNVAPFTPLDLINAFLSNDIRYDNTAKLQNTVITQLEHQFIKGVLDLEKAIKLIAAYPIDGFPERYFDTYGVRKAIDFLLVETQGDIIRQVGGGLDETGRRREARYLLIGLEIQKVNTDWLTGTIREFQRNYFERSQRHTKLAILGFQEVLRTHIFKGDNWKLLRRNEEPSLTQNRMLLYEGAFPNATKKKFPQRQLQVQIVGEHDTLRETSLEGDIVLTFYLQLNIDLPEKERLAFSGRLTVPQPNSINFFLNMSYSSGNHVYSNLHATLDPVISPWKVTPAFLLSLYAYLDEKRQGGGIPKIEDEMIKANFQPSLLESAFHQLFSSGIGAELGIAGIRIIEETVKRRLETCYPDYQTLITSPKWKDSLKKYYLALESLPTVYERQGMQIYEKTKQVLADQIFHVSVSVLETFLASNPLLIKAEGTNQWRFTLHPLEQIIQRLLKESPLAEPPRSGDKPGPYIERETAFNIARVKGYRDDEIEEGLVLLEKRGLIAHRVNRTRIFAIPTRVPHVEDLRKEFAAYSAQLQQVKSILPDHPQIKSLLAGLERLSQLIDNLAKKPDEQNQVTLAHTLRTRQGDLSLIIQEVRSRLLTSIRKTAKELAESDKLNAHHLDQTLPEGLFSLQLNVQRLSLLKNREEVSTKQANLNSRWKALYAQTAQEHITVDILSLAMSEFKRLQEETNTLHNQLDLLGKQLQGYERAYQLLQRASEFQQRCSQVDPQVTEVFCKEFDDWILQVTGTFSSEKLKALEQVQRWRTQLDDIYRRFELEIQREQTRFAGIQADHKTVLLELFRGNRSWADIVFNPSNPQDSYHRLWIQVCEIVQQIFRNKQAELQEVYDRAARLQGGALQVLSVEIRESRQKHIDTQQQNLRDVITNTRVWINNLDKLLPDLQREGTTKPARAFLAPISDKVCTLDEWLSQVSHALSAIEQEVQASQLTPEQEAIMEVLQSIYTENASSEGIEIGLLLQRLQSEASQASWLHIIQLYSKQRLRIKIAPITFD